MTRTVKTPDIRRGEILDVAGTLFRSRGYGATSVDEIVRSAGIAKGTFYYYFKSKEDILAALARQMVTQMAERSLEIANDPDMGAIAKICTIIGAQRSIQETGQNLVDDLHRPENRELHERSNVETVLVFGPILASVIEQGQHEGVFQVDDPLSTVQFILAGSSLMFGHGVFNWTPEEEVARTKAMLTLIERSLGAAVGSFNPILQVIL
jgi:AcrR family transcriptional regulator